jgi:PAS domain S-box-containing protein
MAHNLQGEAKFPPGLLTMTANKRVLFAAMCAALVLGIFVLDLLTPLGVAVWVLYAVPIMFTSWSARSRGVLLTTLTATVLIFVGFFLSPPGIAPSLAMLNRCLDTAMLWLVTAILVKQKFSAALQRERELHERELDRLNRLYAALSQINLAIVRIPTRDELFQKVCQVLVEHGGFHMAWIGWHDPDTHQLVPIAVWGDESNLIRSIKVYADDRPEGRGPSGLAFRACRPYICNDLLNDPVALPGRAELVRGFRASAVFPIRLKNEVCGTLTVYSEEAFFFQDKEIALLEEAATNVSFALDNLARDEARRQAERTLRSEKLFSDTMIESMPGVVYFYDSIGRFLRWNRNFEVVSGYSAEEIARMHPRDFFAKEEQPRVEERIAEVFAEGESSVEASLVPKNGRATLYFFTGRRMMSDDQMCLAGVGIDISERRRAEERLGQSERKYRELVENANSIILRWNAEGLIIFLNEYGQQFFGYSADEIIGRHVLDTIVPRIESGGRDLGQLIEHICAAPEAFAQNINENVRRNGERAWIAWTNRIVRDAQGQVVGFLSIGTDISERKRAEEAQRESEARYRKLFECAPDGIVIADSAGCYIDANASMCRMLGYSRDELIGLQAAHIVVPAAELPHVVEPTLQVIGATSDHHREWRFRRKDGSIFPAEVIATMMPDGNLLGMIRDITERQEAEAEREKRHQAEASDRIKSAFLATMSHELRTPLNSIIGFTGIMLQGLAGPLNAEQSKQLDMVRNSARHLLALVNDVLDISKIEAGQFEVAREPFDMKKSIAKVVALVTPMSEKKGLAFRVNLAPDLGEAVSDERRFEQILLNLLSNAIKFTDRGEIGLHAELIDDFTPPGATASQVAVRLRVSDTGTGIKPADLASLFQPFRQLDSGLSRNHDGTGLGLAICRRLAELMGGVIGVESTWERGSTFSVTLPLRRDSRNEG